MQKVLRELKKLLPGVQFEPGEAFSWSPEGMSLTYRADGDVSSVWALLHEAAHAILGHNRYEYDVELLFLEVDAWEKAKELAHNFAIAIDEEHIQDCLDSYRDWLHQRSMCPRCSTVSLQASSRDYQCHNCSAVWHISASRFCRPYRLSSKQTKKPPETMPQATFQ